ncbi:MAG: PIN domain-containing protein [Acidobacteria bacterium]|nr:PIN domain-containing protein [Acidobacteriota bacterium]
MILVDTSVWIELLNSKPAARVSEEDLVRFVTCGPIVQEVVQGLREGPFSEAFRDAFLALPRLSDPLPLATFLEAAEIYRRGRRKGYTVRSSVDCLIAAIAIENHVPVWHKDRDFAVIARYTGLEVWEKP